MGFSRAVQISGRVSVLFAVVRICLRVSAGRPGFSLQTGCSGRVFFLSFAHLTRSCCKGKGENRADKNLSDICLFCLLRSYNEAERENLIVENAFVFTVVQLCVFAYRIKTPVEVHYRLMLVLKLEIVFYLRQLFG